jgi:hypothetical protein
MSCYVCSLHILMFKLPRIYIKKSTTEINRKDNVIKDSIAWLAADLTENKILSLDTLIK